MTDFVRHYCNLDILEFERLEVTEDGNIVIIIFRSLLWTSRYTDIPKTRGISLPFQTSRKALMWKYFKGARFFNLDIGWLSPLEFPEMTGSCRYPLSLHCRP